MLEAAAAQGWLDRRARPRSSRSSRSSARAPTRSSRTGRPRLQLGSPSSARRGHLDGDRRRRPPRRARSGAPRFGSDEERESLPVFSPLAPAPLALGLETIYEGYLVHYGRPRLFAAPDRDTSVAARRLPLRARPRPRRRARPGQRRLRSRRASLPVRAASRRVRRPTTRSSTARSGRRRSRSSAPGDPELAAARADLRDRGDRGAARRARNACRRSRSGRGRARASSPTPRCLDSRYVAARVLAGPGRGGGRRRRGQAHHHRDAHHRPDLRRRDPARADASLLGTGRRQAPSPSAARAKRAYSKRACLRSSLLARPAPPGERIGGDRGRGRPVPRGHGDRRPHREVRRPGAPLQQPEGLRPPAARQPVRHERRTELAFGVDDLDELGAEGGRRARDPAAAGPHGEGEGPRQAEEARRLDAEDRLEGASARRSSSSRTSTSCRSSTAGRATRRRS